MKNKTAFFFALLLVPAACPRPAAAAGAAEQLGSSAGQAGLPPEPAVKRARPAADSGAERCAPPSPAEEKIYQSDFHWNYTLPEMKARAEEMYASPKRLDKRAYWDAKAKSYVLPPAYDGAPVKIGAPLAAALRAHIEQALELGYADAVFFPDMGHSHLLIPDALWKAKYDKYEPAQYSEMYEEMLADPAVHIFYHTAEQLKTLEGNQPINDEQLLFRRANRNIAGAIKPPSKLRVLQNPQSAANTVSDVPGYRWWGAGFNFSSQQDGCFSYEHKGKTYRFDISLHDLPPDPSAGGGDW